jgi:hypothetical protein
LSISLLPAALVVAGMVVVVLVVLEPVLVCQ